MAEKTPSPPKGTGPRGQKLWGAVVGEYDLEMHELALLQEAVRTIDDLDALDAVVKREGVTLGNSGPSGAG